MKKIKQQIKYLDLQLHSESLVFKKQYTSIKNFEDPEKLTYVTLIGGVICSYLLLTKKGYLVSSATYLAKEIYKFLDQYGQI